MDALEDNPGAPFMAILKITGATITFDEYIGSTLCSITGIAPDDTVLTLGLNDLSGLGSDDPDIIAAVRDCF